MEHTVLTQNDTLEIPKKAKTLRILAMVFLGISAISGLILKLGIRIPIANLRIYQELIFSLGFLCLFLISKNKGTKIATLTMCIFNFAIILTFQLISDSISLFVNGLFNISTFLVFIYLYSLLTLNSNLELNYKRWINLPMVLLLGTIIYSTMSSMVYLPMYSSIDFSGNGELLNSFVESNFEFSIGYKIFGYITSILWFVICYKLCFSSLFCGIYDKDAKPVLNPFNKQVIGAITVAAVTCGLLWLVFINRDLIMEFFL